MAKWREFILPAAVRLTLTAMKGVGCRANSWRLLCTGEEELKEQLRIEAAAQEASAMQQRRLSRLHSLGARLMAGTLRAAAQRTKADTFSQWRRKAQLCPPRTREAVRQELEWFVQFVRVESFAMDDLARVEQNAMPVPFEKDMADKESHSSPLTHESRFLPWGRVPFPDLTEHLENAAPQLLQRNSGNTQAALGELRRAVNQALQESGSRSRPSPGVVPPKLQGDFAEALAPFVARLARDTLLRLLKALSGIEEETLDSLLLHSGAANTQSDEYVDCRRLLDYLWEPERVSALTSPPAAWADRVEVAERLRRRGFSVRQLIRFVKDYRITEGRRLSEMSTADVVREIVIPKTRDTCCAMVDLFEGGPQEPSCLMSHWWGNSFMSLVEAILAHASGQVLPSERMCTPEQLDKTYWLCIFGVNQHVSICGAEANPCDCGAEKFLNDHPLCEMDKFGLMMQRIPEHAVAVDDRLATFSRLWVLKELHTALSLGLNSEFCGRVASDFSVASLQGVRFARASREEDRVMILQEIEASIGYEAFDCSIFDKVRCERAKFAMADAVMRRRPEADAANRPAILELLLQADADPNLPDAFGRTALHAICQWSGSAALARRLVSARADVTAKASAGPLKGKTPAELLLAEDTIKLEHLNRGLTERSSASKEPSHVASPDSRSRPRGAGLLPSPPHEVTGGSSRMGRITL
eukprot:s2415_g6.t1